MAAITAAVAVAAVGAISARKGQQQARKEGKRQAASAAAGRELVSEQFGATREALQPFITGGRPAFELQQALSGSLGPEAQATAFQNFRDSPGTQFLTEQGLRGVEAGQAAGGGLGGGQRLRELTKFSQGLALQDFNQQFGRLGEISRTGLSASQALGGIGAQQAGQQAGLLGQQAQARSAGELGAQQATAQGIEQFVGQIGPIVAGISGAFNTGPTPQPATNFGAPIGDPNAFVGGIA